MEKNAKVQQAEQVQQIPVQGAPQQPVVQQQVVVAEPKQGFGAWCKAHWKGLVAGVTGTGAAVASAIIAYKKGKAAGVMSVPMQPNEDYSLNPNE